VHEIHDQDELHALSGGDTLCLWAAQGLDGRSRFGAENSNGRGWRGEIAMAAPAVRSLSWVAWR
jgi:hypothetical protein